MPLEVEGRRVLAGCRCCYCCCCFSCMASGGASGDGEATRQAGEGYLGPLLGTELQEGGRMPQSSLLGRGVQSCRLRAGAVWVGGTAWVAVAGKGKPAERGSTARLWLFFWGGGTLTEWGVCRAGLEATRRAVEPRPPFLSLP